MVPKNAPVVLLNACLHHDQRQQTKQLTLAPAYFPMWSASTSRAINSHHAKPSNDMTSQQTKPERRSYQIVADAIRELSEGGRFITRSGLQEATGLHVFTKILYV